MAGPLNIKRLELIKELGHKHTNLIGGDYQDFYE